MKEDKKKTNKGKGSLVALGITLAALAATHLHLTATSSEDEEIERGPGDFGPMRHIRSFRSFGEDDAYEEGEGLTKTMLAKMLSFKYVSSGNPNPRPITDAIKRLNIKPTGWRTKFTYGCDNGGSGGNDADYPIYSAETLSRINNFILDKATSEGNGVYNFNGKRFKIEDI